MTSRRDAGSTLCLCWAATVIGLFSLSHGKLATNILPALPPLAILVALLAISWWRRGVRSAIALITPIAIAMGLVFYLGLAPAVTRMVSEQAMAPLIAQHADAPIVSYGVTPASLMFSVPRPILRVGRPGPLRRALAGGDFTWIVTSQQHVAELSHIATVYPWTTTGRHVLYATAPPADVASADGQHVGN